MTIFSWARSVLRHPFAWLLVGTAALAAPAGCTTDTCLNPQPPLPCGTSNASAGGNQGGSSGVGGNVSTAGTGVIPTGGSGGSGTTAGASQGGTGGTSPAEGGAAGEAAGGDAAGGDAAGGALNLEGGAGGQGGAR